MSSFGQASGAGGWEKPLLSPQSKSHSPIQLYCNEVDNFLAISLPRFTSQLVWKPKGKRE